MAGTPGYGPWPSYAAPATQEAQRAQMEAMLRTLREQRPALAVEIAMYLYDLVMQGQLRDPAVVNAFRRLYDHDQQIQQAEVGLRTLSTSLPSVSAMPPYAPQNSYAPQSVPPPSVPQTSWTPPSGPPPPPSGREEPHRPPSSSPPGAARIAGKQAERMCVHCKTPLRPKDTICPVCGLPAEQAAVDVTHCNRCGNELKANDRACPICGTPRV